MKLATIHSELNPWDARIVCNLLRSEGMAATLLGEHHATADLLVSPALGGVRVQVPAEQAEAARALVALRPSFDLPALGLVARWQSGEFGRALEDQMKDEAP